MTNIHPEREPSKWMVVAAFLAIYFVWGSTYLAIRYAVQTLPPFSMAGARFLIAGAILYVWARMNGAPRPAAINWRETAIVGWLLLVGGNGGVVWAEQRVPSGPTALLIATVPLWILLVDWLRRGGVRPSWMACIGVIIGFVGIGLLIDPAELIKGQEIDRTGAVVLVVASLMWSIGSIYSRHARMPSVPMLSSGMQMLAGGALLMVVGATTGEYQRLDVSKVSRESIFAVLYLIVFGSLIGFSAYSWLLRVSTPAKVATYAYVNPIVAVFLGWAIAGEKLDARMLVAAGVIIAGVVFITRARAVQKPVSTVVLQQDEREELISKRACCAMKPVAPMIEEELVIVPVVCASQTK